MSRLQCEILSDNVKSQMASRKLKAGEVLFVQGNPSDSIYFLEYGCVRLVVHPEDDKQLVLYRAQAGEIVAEEHLVQDRYRYTAIAQEDSVLWFVGRQVLLDGLYHSRDVLLRYLKCLSGRYHQLITNFERLGMRSAKSRVLHLLRTMTEEKLGPIDLTGQIKSLSDDLNLTHEAMYRAFRELEVEGVIERIDGKVLVIPSDSDSST